MIFFQTKSIATENSSVKFKCFMIFEMHLNIFRVKKCETERYVSMGESFLIIRSEFFVY